MALRNWLEERYADVNMFDGGKTAQTVRASRPAPAQLPKAGAPAPIAQRAMSAVNRFTGTNRQYRDPRIQQQEDERLRAAKQQAVTGLKSGRMTGAQSDALIKGAAGPSGANTAQKLIAPSSRAAYMGKFAADVASDKRIAPIAAGITRSAVGTGESLAGLYDLASPGQGTNRVSKGMRRAGENVDNVVKDNNYNKWAYKGAQAATDIATFAVGGAPTTKLVGMGTKGASRIPKAAQVAGKVGNAVGSHGYQVGGKFIPTGKAVVKGAKYIARPDVLSDLAVDTALSAGQRSARGQDVNAGTVAADVAMGLLPTAAAGVVGKGYRAAKSTEAYQGGDRFIRSAEKAAKEVALGPQLPLRKHEMNRQGYADVAAYRNMIKNTDVNPDYELAQARADNAMAKAGFDPTDTDSMHRIADAYSKWENDRAAWKGSKAKRKEQRQAATQKLKSIVGSGGNEGGYVGGLNAKGAAKEIAEQRIFEGPDGKLRFEGDDSGARIKDNVIDQARNRSGLNPKSLRWGAKVTDVLDHPKLFADYPELKDVGIVIQKTDPDSMIESKFHGSYDDRKNQIMIGSHLSPEEARKTLLHELQHAIQDREGFASGGSFGDELVDTPILQKARETVERISDMRESGEFDKLPESQQRALIKTQTDAMRIERDTTPFTQYQRLAGEAEARAVSARADMGMGERYAKNRNTFDDSLDVPKDELIVREGGIGPSLYAKVPTEKMEPDLNPEQREFINAYAEMLESMGSGNGVDITPDGRRVSNNFRPGLDDKPMTKAQWFDEARAQLESGKGAYGASDDYKALSAPKATTPDTHQAYGRTIEMTEKNGYKPIATADGGKVYQKVAKRGSNAKGTNLENTWYRADGTKLTQAQAKAMIGGEMRTAKPSPREVPDFSQPLPVTKKQAPKSEPAIFTDPKTQTETELNTKRLNLPEDDRIDLRDETYEVLDKMSNKEIQQIAKNVGIDRKSHTDQQVKEKIAKQLKLRQEVVSLTEQSKRTAETGDVEATAKLKLQAAESGRTSREQGTEIGRELQARKIMANELDTPEQRLYKMLDLAGVNPETYTRRLAEVDVAHQQRIKAIADNDAMTPSQAKKALRAEERQYARETVGAFRGMVPAKSGNWLDLVRYNSMLSSPKTQVVNLGSGLGNVLGVAPVEKALRGSFDAVGGLFGRERQYSSNEGAAYLLGAVKGMKKGASEFVEAMRGIPDITNADMQESRLPLAVGGAKGKAYNTLNFPLKTLAAFDKFVRAMASEGELSAIQTRTAAGIKTKGDPRLHADAEAAYRVFQGDMNQPGQGALLHASDAMAQLLMGGRYSKSPIMARASQFAIPFVKTINNINKQGVEFSPLGYGNMINNSDKLTAFTRATMGTAVFGLAGGMLGAGDLTWGEPRNAEEKAQWKATEGKQAYSMRIGGHWIQYSKMPPAIAFPFALSASIDEAIKDKKMSESNAEAVLIGISKYGQFLSDQSYMKSVGDALAAVKGDTEKVAQVGSNIGQQVIPFRALSGWVARMGDGFERKLDTDKGWVDQQVQLLMQQVPGLRGKTETRDYGGAPIPTNNATLNAFTPVNVTNDRSGQVAAPTVAAGTRKGQKDDTKATIQAAFNSKEGKAFLALSDEDKKLAAANDPETRGMLQQYEAMKKGLGADTTLYPAGLDEGSIGTLGKMERLTPEARDDLFYKQPGAELEYEKAKLAKDKADGTLTRKEQIDRQASIEKLEVSSSYSKEIRDFYEMSKDKVWNLVSKDKDGKRIASELVALGDALEKAGLGENKFRNSKGVISIRPKEAGSGSGGSRRTDFSLFSGGGTNPLAFNKSLRDIVKNAKL